MSNYEFLNFESHNKAIYINFPFCPKPCLYCHYIDNIDFGYKKIPDEYINLLNSQLEDLCKILQGEKISSIYFGGGTPSLLQDYQLDKIKGVFEKYSISADEISIEIHPGYCNFNLAENKFFNRYSIAVQDLNEDILATYGRKTYNFKSICDLIEKSKEKLNIKINIDLIFNEKINFEDIIKLKELEIDTITVYPNTKGRGERRLKNILNSLKKLPIYLDGFEEVAKSKFIFKRIGERQSNYSVVECEYMGDIIGIGHNSRSAIGEKCYLTTYSNDNYELKFVANNRYLSNVIKGIPFGVLYKFLKEIDDDMKAFLFNIENKSLIDKHLNIKENDLVYLPENNYKVFYEYLRKKYPMYLKCFLESIQFGDSNEELLEKVYNFDLEENVFNDLKEYAKKNSLNYNDMMKKRKFKNQYILIEGIDGSGKDTFANFLIDELKKRFYFSDDSRLSIMGQPGSKFQNGLEAKKFIEDKEIINSTLSIDEILRNNRLDIEKTTIKKNRGITIYIRGLLTDLATYKVVFNKVPKDLGQGKHIKKFRKLIIIDIEPNIADLRIYNRGGERTWREYPEWLKHFREFYLSYNDDRLFEEKIIIKSKGIEFLKCKAKEMANELYFESQEGEKN